MGVLYKTIKNTKKERFLVNWHKIYTTKSKIDGVGVHATCEIKRGETIAIIKGKLIHLLVVDKATAQAGANWVGIKKDVWIDTQPPLVYLNHSCDPNAGIRGKVTLVALRNIERGEEVTLDYSTTEETLNWDLQCHCGVKECRKVIGAIQFLPKKIFKKYLPAIPHYFQRVYLRYNKEHARKS